MGLALITATFAVALFGIPLAIGLAEFAVSEEHSSLQRLAGFAARSVQSDMAHDRVPRALPDGPSDAAVALYDADGALLLGAGPSEGDAAVDYVLGGRTGLPPADDLVVAVPVSGLHDIVGVVRATAPSSQVYASVMPIWLGMAALAAVVLVSTWLLARRLALRLSRPLDRLVDDADRLGDGDFGIRPKRSGIAETDRVSGALSRTACRLDDLLARERAFSAEASHQLRTPLTGLRLRLESALDAAEPMTRPQIEYGLGSIDRLERTIDELLALARERQTTSAPADLPRLFSEFDDEWRPRLTRDGRSFSSLLPGSLPEPDASSAAVRQILGVLLDNALLHGAGDVSISAREVGENAIAIDVGDQGPGVPSSALTNRDVGRGMGLPLARRLAESEGGRLTVGTTSSPVTLLLPSRSRAGSAEGSEDPSAPPAMRSTGRPGH
ncbi:two-component sensor histidine kinase [Pseudonocardia saturnea]|uniref:Signal transduction histidine-protein kinase/phosphatase MprB n=1 Tax=Pseudonocardia saturnea TaxID=33909 RepID=A0ABQ0S1U5_9PSEU|nr:two-component sensor histidine kinase [Pseudonocardia autotrophica]GEC26882.1 two-component sensor histidine kinase [Pseudonocardia saturnea]